MAGTENMIGEPETHQIYQLAGSILALENPMQLDCDGKILDL